MAHPFFDTPTYPWWLKPEADELHHVLYEVISNPLDIERWYKGCGKDFPPLALGQASNLIWQEALEKLTSRGVLRKLCDSLLADRDLQKAAELRNVIQAVIDAKSAEKVRVTAVSDPVPVLDRINLREQLNPVPVLDRVNLREQLKLLDDNSHPVKVLVIRGQRFSGKSHSRILFEYAARCRGASSVYLCQGIMPTVKDAVAELFLVLDPEYRLPEFDTSDPASYLGICREMLRVAMLRKRNLWIAVDDLGVGSADGAPLVEEEIRRFFDQFALMLVNPPYRERFRLMLINYPGNDVPPKWKSDIWEEDMPVETDILANHITEALMEWAARRKKTLLEDEVQRYTQQVMAARTAPTPPGHNGRADDKSPLRRMYDALVKILNSI